MWQTFAPTRHLTLLPRCLLASRCSFVFPFVNRRMYRYRRSYAAMARPRTTMSTPTSASTRTSSIPATVRSEAPVERVAAPGCLGRPALFVPILCGHPARPGCVRTRTNPCYQYRKAEKPEQRRPVHYLLLTMPTIWDHLWVRIGDRDRPDRPARFIRTVTQDQ